MALPKNFNQINDRVESLNDLTFYRAIYDFKYHEEFKDCLKDKNDRCILISESINGTHEFTALNDEIAKEKITHWLDSLVETKILESFSSVKITSMSFMEKIKEKNLDIFLK